MEKFIWHTLFASLCLIGTGCGQQNHTSGEPPRQKASTTTMMEAPSSGAVVESIAQYRQLAPQVQGHLQELYEAYFALKDALVAGDTARAAHAAKQLLAQDKHFDYSWFPAAQKAHYDAISKPMRPLFKSMSSGTDLQQQRKYFEQISAQFYLLAKAFGGRQIFYEFCPMAFNDKGAYWMSATDSIANPYFGDAMLRCGKVVEVIR